MMLDDVNRGIVKHKKRNRVGRGPGSGHGKTAARGHKGQGQLAGWSHLVVFEGGQMPTVRRIPKRGFTNSFARSFFCINVRELESLYEAGEEVNEATLREKKVVRGEFDFLKILGTGDLTKKLKVSAHKFSKSAEEKIKAAGGEVLVLPGPKAVVKNKMKPRKPKN